MESLIRYGGLLAVFLVVYGTTGLFFCFFIPVGAFLFTAGIFIATGGLGYDLITCCSILILGSVLGNLTGYWFGWKAGNMLYQRKDSRFFKKKHLIAAASFYKKYGGLALTIGLYIPIIRTFASIVAGIVRLDFRRYFLLVFAGSVLWIFGFIFAGYFVGTRPELKQWSNYIVIGFLLLFTLPLMIWVIKEMKKLSNKDP